APAMIGQSRRQRWPLPLLAERVVASAWLCRLHMRASAACDKNGPQAVLKKPWCIPEVGAECGAAMADVLEGYAEPSELRRPQVHLHETSPQLLQATRQPLPAQPGRPSRDDDA